MRNICVGFLSSLLLLASCGKRQPVEQSKQQTVPPSAQPAAPPASAIDLQPAVPVDAQPVPPPAAAYPQPAYREPAFPEPAYPEPANVAGSTPQPAPAQISVPAGTILRVRLDQTLDTRRNRPGDRFTASLVRRISEHGITVIPAGTRCYGHLIAAKPSGRFKGRAVLSLRLDSFDFERRHYEIATTVEARRSGAHKKRNWVLIGGGPATGAAIGAVAAGPFGALVGAGAGGAAGTVGAAITGKKNVRLPAETVLAFSLRASVPIVE